MAEGVNAQSVAQHRFPDTTGAMDMGNKFYRYLGPPVGHVTPSPYDKTAFTNYDLPEYYKGKNLFLRDTIDGFIMEDNRWYTTVALPWAQTDQLHIQWNVWQFNTALADRVPHEGISRLITSSKKQFRTHVVRRGLAFVMEADHFGTPEGDVQYQRNILGIAQSVQETQDHDTIFALLTCKDYFRMWELMYGRLGFSRSKLLDDQINNYAAVVRDADRLEILYEQHKRLMRKYGVIPDLLILWPTAAIYLTMGQPEKTKFWSAGPEGTLMFKNGPKSLATFRDGTNVFETRDFDVYTDEPPVQLLTRQIHVSEYYPVLFGDWRDDLVYEYLTRWRDTVLYDENKDNFVKMKFREMFLHANIFGPDGDYHPELKRLEYKYKKEGRVVDRSSSEAGMMDDYDRDGWGRQNKSKDPPLFFLAAPDNDNVPFLIQYFGQMDLTAATSRDFMQIGQTILARVFPHIADAGGISAEQDIWNDMINLVHSIESQRYNHEYWRQLIQANEPYSLDASGNFIGESTPRELLAHWGVSKRLTEWAPNTAGSLVLPNGNGLDDVEYPAGFANGPGLRTLAKEASKPESHWRQLGKRAEDIINMFGRFVSILQQLLPTSEAISEKNRSPWFHRADPLTAFFEQVVSVNRDPIWLAALSPVMRGDKVRGKTYGGTEDMDVDEIPWFPVPLFVVNPGEMMKEGDDAVIARLLLEMYDGNMPDVIRDNLDKMSHDGTNMFVYKSILTGEVVQLPQQYLYHSAMIPKEIRVMLLMGQTSITSLYNISQLINTDEYYPETTPEKIVDQKKELKDKLIGFIYGYSKTNSKSDLRKVINALAIKGTDPQDMFNTIRTIHITNKSTKTAQKQAAAQIRALVKDGGPDDPDLEISAALNAFQPRGFKQFGDDTEMESKQSLPYADVRDKLEDIFDRVAEIESIRKIAPLTAVAAPGPFTLDIGEATTWVSAGIGANPGIPGAAYTALAESFGAKGAELLRLVNEVEEAVDAAGVPGDQKATWRTDAVRRYGGKRDKFSVQDDEDAGMRASYYRSPLTMSLELLESLSTFGPAALIRVSDPSTGHTTFYYDDSGRDRKGQFSLPTEIWERPQYATISAIWMDKDAKGLDETALVSRHKIIASDTSSSSSSGFGNKKSSGPFNFDDDDDDDDSDDLFGEKKRKHPSSKVKSQDSSSSSRKKGRRFATDFDSATDSDAAADDDDLIGQVFGDANARGSFRDPEGGWNRQSLRKGTRDSGVDVRRPFSAFGMEYSPEYNKIKTDTFVHRYRQSNTIPDPFLRAVVQAVLLSKSSGEQWLRMIDNDIHVPVNLLLWRMQIEHDMSSAILMKGGLETGANIYGHSNFATGNDVVSKIIYGNYTFYSKAVVWKERNVILLENIKPEGYRGGNNTEFIRIRKDFSSQARDRSSLIVTAVPITENSFPKEMSITGYLGIDDANEFVDGAPAVSYTTYEYYDALWRFSDSVKTSDPGRDNYFELQDRINHIAFQGQQAIYNRSTKVYNRWIECQGHRGKNGSYPGAAQVWNGSIKFLEKYDFSQKVID